MNESIIDIRKKNLKAMHTLMCNSNDENIAMTWLAGGVPDAPHEDDFEFIANTEDLYNDCVNLFIALIQKKGWKI